MKKIIVSSAQTITRTITEVTCKVTYVIKGVRDFFETEVKVFYTTFGEKESETLDKFLSQGIAETEGVTSDKIVIIENSVTVDSYKLGSGVAEFVKAAIETSKNSK